MKTIKIFLASSEELKPEREMMASLANSLNTILEKQDIHVIAVEWENLDASMGVLHKQEDYNEKLRGCDICMVMYWTKFGMYTKMELDTAYDELKGDNTLKKVYVYFKEGKEPSEELKAFRDSFPEKYGHFYTPFTNNDTLKAHFLLQFLEYQSKNLDLKSTLDVKNGKVVIDGTEYVELKNVPFAGNNEEYNLLLKSIKKTQKLLAITDEDDEEYAEYVSELHELKEKLEKMEASLWDTVLMITRLSTTKCSDRLKRAMDLFNAGDNKGAQAVLNEEEIEKDVEHNLYLIQLGEEGKKGLKINIEEYELKIKTLENEMAEGWLQEQCKIHDRIIELTGTLYGKHSLELANAMMNATRADYALDNYHRLRELVEKSLEIRLEILGEEHLDTAQCYNDLGVACGKLGDNQKFLEYSSKSLDLRLALCTDKAELAESYGNVGAALLLTSGDKEKNLEYTMKALILYKQAFGDMHLKTASALNEVGCAYFELDNFERGLEYCIQSLKIREKMVGNKHPDTGQAHNNVANAYISLEKYDAAIEHLNKALDISVSTVGKVAPSSLTIIDNLSFVHEMNDNIEKSLDYIMDAIKISEKLNGDTDAQTIKFFKRAGELLVEYGDRKEALSYLYHTLDLHFKKAKEENFPTGPAPTRELADLCHEIGSIHFGMNAFEEAEQMLGNAVDIISDVEECAPELREWTYHLGLVYAKQGKHNDALNSFQSALKHRINEYGQEHPDVVDAYEMVGRTYAALGNNDKAIESYKNSLAILEKHLAQDHEEILRLKRLIADCQ